MNRCPACAAVFTAADFAAPCPDCGTSPAVIDGFTAFAPALARQGGGFKPEYFAELAQREAGHFWFQARNRLIQWALQTCQPDGRSFLEIGCGTGFVLAGIAAAFPQRTLYGSEIFVEGLSFAAQRVPRATFSQMDARHIPFSNAFDAIGAFDVLEHIDDDELILQSIHQALAPDGMLLLTVPQHPWLWSQADDFACHVRRYTAGEIHDKLARAGFKRVRSTSFVSLLLPAMMLARLGKQHTVAHSLDDFPEFRIHKVLNRLFGAILALERCCIQWGINWPVGGSRLVIARKRPQ